MFRPAGLNMTNLLGILQPSGLQDDVTGDIMNKKILFFILGFALVIIGITLTLRDWLFLVMVFRGVFGPLLAVAGLIVLTLCKD